MEQFEQPASFREPASDEVRKDCDFYFQFPEPIRQDSIYYSIHRVGIAADLPLQCLRDQPREAPCHTLLCILSGTGELQSSGKPFALQAGDLALLPRGQYRDFHSTGSSPMSGIWMEFYGSDSDAIVNKINLGRIPMIHGSVYSTIVTLMGALINKMQIRSRFQPSLEVYEILLTLLHYKDDLIHASQVSGDVCSFALIESYINSHLNSKISNQELAYISHQSVSSFIKGFKKYYQVTPQQYIVRLRVAKAKYILTKTNDSLDTIAENLGFCNTSHFVRKFKEETGLPPAQYRKQYFKSRPYHP